MYVYFYEKWMKGVRTEVLYEPNNDDFCTSDAPVLRGISLVASIHFYSKIFFGVHAMNALDSRPSLTKIHAESAT